MAINRYRRDNVIRGVSQYATAAAAQSLYQARRAGLLATERYILTGRERLDTIAGHRYGDGRLWWVIAATSGVGWALQCPPGTVLYIPTDLGQIMRMVG